MTILALTGGIGGAKLCLGLAKILEPDDVTFVVNTGDDFEHMGLNISPDIDTLTYTLAGVVNESTGWGRANESWDCLTELKQFDAETWFQLGDRDLALHLFRTSLLKTGHSLSEVTELVAAHFDIDHAIVPVTDDLLRTVVQTDQDELNFQDYFVRLKCEPKVSGIKFLGSETAKLSPYVDVNEISGVVICPSNPFLSVDPLLAVKELRKLLLNRDFPVIAVSPIVGDQAIKGPTTKMMQELGLPSTCTSVANHYEGLIDGMILDPVDSDYREKLESMHISVCVTPTVMTSIEHKKALAKDCMTFLEQLS